MSFYIKAAGGVEHKTRERNCDLFKNLLFFNLLTIEGYLNDKGVHIRNSNLKRGNFLKDLLLKTKFVSVR